MSSQPRKALIVAGGTGGHIFPGLTIAQALAERGWQVEWAGNPSAMEGKLVPTRGIKLNTLVFSGFRGKGLLAQLLIPLKLLRAFFTSVQILRRLKPSVVIGMGGYVSFPMGMMASFMNIPLVVHEQNSIAGLTNKVLAKLADLTLVAFPRALPQGQWVGNPVRPEATQQATPEARFGGRTGPLRLLVLGGSLGAQALNELVPKALAQLDDQARPEVIHQAGEKHLAQLKTNYEQAGVSAQCVAFIDEVSEEMAKADVMICRSGAMTVAELSAIGVASLLVPFPHAVDDHQTHNARYLLEHEAAWLKQQKDITPEGLAQWMKSLNRAQCLAVASKARAVGKPEATDRIVADIEKIAKQ